MKRGILTAFLFVVFAYTICCKKETTIAPITQMVKDSTYISITIHIKGIDTAQYWFEEGYGTLGGDINKTTIFYYIWPEQGDSNTFVCTVVKSGNDSIWFSATVNNKPVKSIATEAFAFRYK